MLKPDVILASNTSSISITRLAAQTQRPSQVIGMHFFNPVPVMKLVEVIRGLETSDETFAQVKALAEALGKSPVEVNDAPGFVSNRVLMPLLNEAMYAVMEGVATAEAVDQVFQLGMAHPMGPLKLADFIGLDVCLDIMRVMVEGLGDPKYRPCPLLDPHGGRGLAGPQVGTRVLPVLNGWEYPELAPARGRSLFQPEDSVCFLDDADDCAGLRLQGEQHACVQQPYAHPGGCGAFLPGTSETHADG